MIWLPYWDHVGSVCGIGYAVEIRSGSGFQLHWTKVVLRFRV